MLVRAAGAEGPAPASAASPSSEPADAPRAEHAGGAAYRQALALYQAGDVRGALEQMRESHRLSQRPELLYNIARLEAELGDCQAALGSYRKYVELVPNGRYREAANRALIELEATCAPAPVAAAPSTTVTDGTVAPPSEALPSPLAPAENPSEPPVTAAPPAYWTASRWIGWSAIAAGTVAGVSAIYFTTRAHRAHDEFEASVERHYRGMGRADFTLEPEQHRHQTRALALAIASGALVAGGALVLLLAPRESGAASRSVAVSAYPLGLQLSSSF